MKRKYINIGVVIVIFLLICTVIYALSREKQEMSNEATTEEVASRAAETALEKQNKDELQIVDEDAQEESVEPLDDEYVRILDYIPDVIVDLRYATDNNFTGTVIYDFSDAYLRYGTVKKLAAAQEKLKALGYRIKIWDAYRPFSAQERLWEVCPNPRYVANPANGMKAHNLGGTIDMTIVTLVGDEVQMPSGFDDFSPQADRDYSDVSEVARVNAEMLERVMTECGFVGYEGEWWDYSDTTQYVPVDFEP